MQAPSFSRPTRASIAIPWYALSGLCAAGAVIGTASMLASTPAHADVEALWRNIALAAAFALATFTLGRLRAPRALTHVCLLGGVYLVSNAAFQSGDGGSYYAVWYIWVALFAFAFFSRRAACLHLTVVAGAYAGVLALRPVDDALARWITTVTTLLIAAAFVDQLVRGLRRYAAEADQLMAQLRRVAETDELTGLANRRSWEAALARELARARRTGAPLSVAVLDLDGFKLLNDRDGHQAGDAILREAAAIWSDMVRDLDTLARWGGDEFGLIIAGSGADDAAQVVERLRRTTPAGTTCSAGLATYVDGEDATTLLARADDALYRAKRTGRDRLVDTTPVA